jgi:hypothetical protein
MANAFSKEEIVLFELLLDKFDPNNITAKQVSKFRPEMTQQERTGYTVWRPIPYVSSTVQGLDITSAYANADFDQLSVPSTIDRIENVPWTLNAQELNDPLQRERKAESAAQKLSAVLDNAIATLVGTTGSLVVTSAAAASGYTDVATAETRMLAEDINLATDRAMILNGTDWQGMAANLANRETMMGKPNSAYERSYVGPVAGFDTFRTSFNPTLTAAAGGGAITVTGTQSYVPRSTATNAINGGQSNVDNRYMNLTVSATAGVAAGDALTIAGVNTLSMIHKNDTGELRTFRVVSVTDGTTLVISPPVIQGVATPAEAQYANCSAAAADGVAIVFLNIATVPVNTFWSGESVEIIEGKLATPQSDMAGVSTMRSSTDSGVEILFAKGGDVGTLAARYRLTMFFGVTNLQPQMNGISLFNQV